MPRHTHHATGILPDDVLRDPASNAWLLACTLRPDLPSPLDWLTRLHAAITELRGDPAQPRASVTVGFGPSFFTAPDGSARFGLQRMPAAFTTPPPLPEVGDPTGQADVLLYLMSPSEAAVAEFQLALSHTRPDLAGVAVERGYQRAGGREMFGFPDGLRNVPRPQRHDVVYTEVDAQPDEPHWADGGTYMAYLKIHQDLDAIAAVPADELERILGRRRDDGSRLDLPAGSNPRRDEGDFPPGDVPPPASHVRKSGPRGTLHDQNLIFRRGVPYLTLRADGGVDAGLQFVSFQATFDAFDVVLRHWMFNPNFPHAGAGPDLLFARGLARIDKAGAYFVPPDDGRPIGTIMFDAPPAPPRPRTGRLVLRKRAADTNGQPTLAELGGIRFQLFDPATGQPIGDTFVTNPAGHAMSDDVPINTTVLLRELEPPAHFQPRPDEQLTITERRQLHVVTNVALSPGYGG